MVSRPEMNCTASSCVNGDCLPSGEGFTCMCSDGFSGATCETAEGPILSVQVIAAIAAACVIVIIICLVLLSAVCYSVWRKYKDRNAIHVRPRRSRSVHDRYSKKNDHSLVNRYNPEHYDPAMYENKAAAIVERWDSKEDLDPKYTGEANPTGRPTRSARKPNSALAKVTHTSQHRGHVDTFAGVEDDDDDNDLVVDDDDSLDHNHLILAQDMPLPQIDLQSNSQDGDGFMY